MGSPPDEPGHEAQEKRHAVTLSHPTWISRTEITQAQWTADEHCPYPESETTDPLARCGAELHVIRGGSWAFDEDSARCAVRYAHAPEQRGYSLGFRLVREEGEP